MKAELSPLIPRQALFGTPVKTSPKISPDGTMIAYLAPSDEGIINIWVGGAEESDEKMVTQEKCRPILDYFWGSDIAHLLYLQDSDGDENWHLFASDIRTGGTIRDLTPFQGVKAQNIILHPDFPDEILVGLNLRDRKLFDMYRVNLTTGEVALDTQNTGDVLSWTIDTNFVIRAATVFRAEDGATILRVRDGAAMPWRDLQTWRFEDGTMFGQVNGAGVAIGFSKDGDEIFVVSAAGNDTARLVTVSVKTGKIESIVAEDPHSDVAFDPLAFPDEKPQVLFDPVNGKVEAVGFHDLLPEWKFVDQEIEKDFEFLAKKEAGAILVSSRDCSNQRWVVEYHPDNAQASYMLYDRSAKKIALLSVDNPDLLCYNLASMKPVEIYARDGIRLVCYLTLPVGIPAKNLPTVLLVHGGPWARDSWGFDPLVQLLANRGYAVLQVNYRGSAGFGKRFLNAANKEWGPGKMLQDRTDAVLWAIQEGIADPGRIAIMGRSYGGYAALCGLIFNPELFVCGVDLVGPSDVKALLESFPDYWEPVKKRWILRIGDAQGDEELNRCISPLYHAEKIRVPLLIGHGANDSRVKIRASDEIVKSMRARNLPVTYVVYPDEGHGFTRFENSLDFVGRVEGFLAKYLGGRTEPWKAVPGSSAKLR